MLGYVHAGTVRAEFMRSVLDVAGGPDRDPRIGEVADETAGALIGKARNMLAARFLRSPAEWLWMVDTDVIFGLGALGGLLAAADPDGRPVVSGLVYILQPNGGRLPSMHEVDGDGPTIRFTPVLRWEPGAVIEVGACGAACLLVHRSVFGKLGSGWFDPIPVPGRGLIGDDWSFCLRLGEAGIPVHVATGVQAGHVKSLIVGSVSP